MTLNTGLNTYSPTNFNHLGFGRGQQLPILEQMTGANGVRYYNTPTGKRYPSVTTVLSQHNKDVIDAWKARVGEAEANAISRRAAGRGTGVHLATEKYLNNEDPWTPGSFVNPLVKESFTHLKPLLDRIDNIHCQETKMFSHHLRLAGTVDCIAEFDGKLSVIDFKTSGKSKKKEWISSYFMQCAAYAVMYEELTGIPISRLVVLISVEEETEPQLFVEKRDNWIGGLIELRDQYEKSLLTDIDSVPTMTVYPDDRNNNE